MQETVFDNMKCWTNEMSHRGLNCCLLSSLTGVTTDSRNESLINQLLCFMVRDLERSRQ